MFNKNNYLKLQVNICACIGKAESTHAWSVKFYFKKNCQLYDHTLKGKNIPMLKSIIINHFNMLIYKDFKATQN